MSEQVDKTWKNIRCLYAEDLKNKRVTLTIKTIRDTPEGARLFCRNETSCAWDIQFQETDKDGRSMYIQIPTGNTFGKRTTLLRQYVMACGGDPSQEHCGRKITLYPIASKKSATSQAIRIAVPEAMA